MCRMCLFILNKTRRPSPFLLSIPPSPPPSRPFPLSLFGTLSQLWAVAVCWKGGVLRVKEKGRLRYSTSVGRSYHMISTWASSVSPSSIGTLSTRATGRTTPTLHAAQPLERKERGQPILCMSLVLGGTAFCLFFPSLLLLCLLLLRPFLFVHVSLRAVNNNLAVSNTVADASPLIKQHWVVVRKDKQTGQIQQFPSATSDITGSFFFFSSSSSWSFFLFPFFVDTAADLYLFDRHFLCCVPLPTFLSPLLLLLLSASRSPLSTCALYRFYLIFPFCVQVI